MKPFSLFISSTIAALFLGCAATPSDIALERHDLIGTYSYNQSPFAGGELALAADGSFGLQIEESERGATSTRRYWGEWVIDDGELVLEPNDPDLLLRIGDSRYIFHRIPRGVQIVPTRIADQVEARNYARVTHFLKVADTTREASYRRGTTGGPRR